MRAPPLPPDEEERLQSLYAYRVLDTLNEEGFDGLTRLVSQVCQTPIALVSLVDRNRQWFKSRVGLDVSEMERDLSFCSHAIHEEDLFVVPDTFEDPRFADNPLVRAGPKIRFYAGAVLHSRERRRLGTLCLIDQVPRRLTDAQVDALRTIRRQVEAQLEVRRSLRELGEVQLRLVEAQNALTQSEHSRRDLSTFVAQDLQQPLGVIQARSRTLLALPELGAEGRAAGQALLEAAQGIEEKVKALVGAERGEDAKAEPPLQAVNVVALIHEVAREFAWRAGTRQQRLVVVPGATCPAIPAGRDLVRRVLENLIGNALQYSPDRSQIEVDVRVVGTEQIELSVTDEGPGIPQESRQQIFQRSVKRTPDSDPGSWGLGLAFCKLAVEAHGGKIWMEPRQPRGSVFRMRLPVSGKPVPPVVAR